MKVGINRFTLGMALVLLLVGLAACRGGNDTVASGDVSFELVGFEPETLTVGDVVVVLKVVRGEAETPIAGAQVEVQGDMNHAGMVPVMGSGQTDSEGIVRVPFRWSMGGEWIVTVTITTSDGQRHAGQFQLDVAS